MEYILIIVAALVFLTSIILQIIMTVSYRRDVKLMTLKNELNVDNHEISLQSFRKKYNLYTAFLVSSLVFSLSFMIVIYLNLLEDFSCIAHVYIFHFFLFLEQISMIILTALIAIILYKRSKFE